MMLRLLGEGGGREPVWEPDVADGSGRPRLNLAFGHRSKAPRRTPADESGDESVPTDQKVRRARCVPDARAGQGHERAARATTRHTTRRAGPSTATHNSLNIASKLV